MKAGSRVNGSSVRYLLSPYDNLPNIAGGWLMAHPE
jgi:hypothetical protein